MRWFNNMKISAKMIMGFLIVALIAGAVGVVGIRSLNSNTKQYSDLFVNYGESQGQLGYIAEAFQQARAAVRDLIIETDSPNYKQYQDVISKSDVTINKNLAEYAKTCITSQEQADYKELVKTIDDYN